MDMPEVMSKAFHALTDEQIAQFNENFPYLQRTLIEIITDGEDGIVNPARVNTQCHVLVGAGHHCFLFGQTGWSGAYARIVMEAKVNPLILIFPLKLVRKNESEVTIQSEAPDIQSLIDSGRAVKIDDGEPSPDGLMQAIGDVLRRAGKSKPH